MTLSSSSSPTSCTPGDSARLSLGYHTAARGQSLARPAAVTSAAGVRAVRLASGSSYIRVKVSGVASSSGVDGHGLQRVPQPRCARLRRFRVDPPVAVDEGARTTRTGAVRAGLGRARCGRRRPLGRWAGEPTFHRCVNRERRLAARAVRRAGRAVPVGRIQALDRRPAGRSSRGPSSGHAATRKG
jgi:hypothetical protein